MPFEIIRQDLTEMDVDAIVNTANRHPIVGTGLDSGVHTKAGPELLKAREAIGYIAPGDAAITEGYKLPARYVVHAVGPVWQDGQQGEEELLASCIRRSLELAWERGCRSIAFPLIGSGNNGVPKDKALQLSLREFTSFLLEHEMQIYLAVFDDKAFRLSEKLFASVSSFIDENYVREVRETEHAADLPDRFGALSRRERNARGRDWAWSHAPTTAAPAAPKSLDELLGEQEAGFSETLLALVERSGEPAHEIYRRALIDKKLYSKIKNNPDYKPTKATALAFAMALRLNVDETKDLLRRAGYTLTNSSKSDLIVQYFLQNQKYDVMELNEALYSFGLPLIVNF